MSSKRAMTGVRAPGGKWQIGLSGHLASSDRSAAWPSSVQPSPVQL